MKKFSKLLMCLGICVLCGSAYARGPINLDTFAAPAGTTGQGAAGFESTVASTIFTQTDFQSQDGFAKDSFEMSPFVFERERESSAISELLVLSLVGVLLALLGTFRRNRA